MVKRRRFWIAACAGVVLGLLLSACGVDDEVVVSGEGAPISVLGKAIDAIGGSGVADVSRVLEADCLAERGLTSGEIESSLDSIIVPPQVSATDFGVASSVRADIDQMIAYLDDLADGGLARDELWGTPEKPGCRQIVDEKLNGPINAFFEEFGPKLAQMERDYATDPRVRSFWNVWKACMADTGYNVSSVDQLANSFTDEANDILTQVEIGPSSGLGVLDILQPREDQEKGGLDTEVESRLDDLQRREELAVEATTRCDVPPAETIPPELVDVRLEYEAKFLVNNGDRVEQLQVEAATTFAAALEDSR